MKVNIGPYNKLLIPVYKLEDLYFETKYGENANYYDGSLSKMDTFVSNFCDWLNKIVTPINNWWVDRPRKVKVRIDKHDLWSADHTLALIIHPVLVKLKEIKHGSPSVDLDDVPEHLHPTELPSKENGWTDNTVHDRWNYVLDEMIWAFETYAKDEDDDRFFSDGFGSGMTFLSKEYAEHRKRIDNGLRLFGKYYSGLWD